MSEQGSIAPQRILAYAGYASSDDFKRLEENFDLYVAVSAGDHSERRYDFRLPRKKPPKKITNPRPLAMSEKVRTEEGRRIYAKRKCTVEPTFGIIKRRLDSGSSCCAIWRKSGSSGRWSVPRTT